MSRVQRLTVVLVLNLALVAGLADLAAVLRALMDRRGR